MATAPVYQNGMLISGQPEKLTGDAYISPDRNTRGAIARGEPLQIVHGGVCHGCNKALGRPGWYCSLECYERVNGK